MSGDKPFELRAGMQLLTSVHLLDTDLDAFASHLEETVRKAPALFGNAPVILDLQAIAEAVPDLKGIRRLLESAAMVPVAVRSGSERQKAAARAAGWALLPEGRPVPRQKGPTAAGATEEPRAGVTVLTRPVRSGQQIYARGDLVVSAQVSAGAEVVADGCIHVYSPLRGRAIAGARGDTEARIFCQSLHAELVCIAGRYRTLENVETTLLGCPCQVSLHEERIVIEPL